jgi:nucleoside-diphosphate-sugar epimerase
MGPTAYCTAQGGGHAFIGYHLAKQLIAKGHDVTILNDGDKVGRRGGGELQRARMRVPKMARQAGGGCPA